MEAKIVKVSKYFNQEKPFTAVTLGGNVEIKSDFGIETVQRSYVCKYKGHEFPLEEGQLVEIKPTDIVGIPATEQYPIPKYEASIKRVIEEQTEEV